MATFTQEITFSEHDASESGGTVSFTNGALNASGTTQYIGFIFFTTAIPKYATINSATLDVYLTSGAYDDPDVTIYCARDDYEIGSGDYSISSLTATTGVTWSASNLGTGVKTTPDFKDAVQERVDSIYYGPPSFPKIVIVVIKGNSSSSKLRIRAYDAGGGNYAKLTIDYTPVSNVPRRLTRPYIRM